MSEFRAVNCVNQSDDGANIIIKQLNSYSAAKFTLADFHQFWNT